MARGPSLAELRLVGPALDQPAVVGCAEQDLGAVGAAEVRLLGHVLQPPGTVAPAARASRWRSPSARPARSSDRSSGPVPLPVGRVHRPVTLRRHRRHPVADLEGGAVRVRRPADDLQPGARPRRDRPGRPRGAAHQLGPALGDRGGRRSLDGVSGRPAPAALLGGQLELGRLRGRLRRLRRSGRTVHEAERPAALRRGRRALGHRWPGAVPSTSTAVADDLPRVGRAPRSATRTRAGPTWPTSISAGRRPGSPGSASGNDLEGSQVGVRFPAGALRVPQPGGRPRADRRRRLPARRDRGPWPPASEVWRAQPIEGGPLAVAVKRARRDGVAPLGRLRAEAEILAELDLPNVVRVLDVVADGGDVAIVMDLARGGSLDELLAGRDGSRPARWSRSSRPWRWHSVPATGAGCSTATSSRPTSSSATGANRCSTDFGVSRPAGPARGRRPGGQRRRTSTRSCSPRVGPIRPTTSTRSASLSYVALTGRLPHAGATVQEILDAAARGAHRPLLEVPDVPPLLAAAIEAALARDPAGAPDAEYFAATLRAAVHPLRSCSPPRRPRGVAAPSSARRPSSSPGASVPSRSDRPPTPTPSPRRAGIIGALAVVAVLSRARASPPPRSMATTGSARGPSAAAVLDRVRRPRLPRGRTHPAPRSGPPAPRRSGRRRLPRSRSSGTAR